MSKRQNLMAAPAKRHDGRGNCVDEVTIYGCRECGKDNICDVCHHHDMPRGECGKCPACPVCRLDAAGHRDTEGGR